MLFPPRLSFFLKKTETLAQIKHGFQAIKGGCLPADLLGDERRRRKGPRQGDKDSGERQRQAIKVYAKAAGVEILDEYYDEAVSGADIIDTRPGFAAMLERLLANGVRMIVVERLLVLPAILWCRKSAMPC